GPRGRDRVMAVSAEACRVAVVGYSPAARAAHVCRPRLRIALLRDDLRHAGAATLRAASPRRHYAAIVSRDLAGCFRWRVGTRMEQCQWGHQLRARLFA